MSCAVSSAELPTDPSVEVYLDDTVTCDMKQKKEWRELGRMMFAPRGESGVIILIC